MAQPQDHYEVLQVHRTAHPDVIQAAYRRLALLYHPDRNPSDEATAMMARLNEAYEVLSDPKRRAKYDREQEIPREYASPDKREPSDVASAAPGADRRSRGRARGFGGANAGGAAKSAATALKWQIGFFGRYVSAIAGAAALILSGWLIFGAGELGAFFVPFIAVAFFWWWFLGSVVLFVVWKVLQTGFTLARSRVRAPDAGEGPAPPPAAEDQGTSWEDLRRQLATAGRAARDLILRLVRYFGWPISLIAAALTVWGLWLGASGFTLLEIVIPLVVLGPAVVLAVFAVWLFFAVLLFVVGRLLKRSSAVQQSGGEGRRRG